MSEPTIQKIIMTRTKKPDPDTRVGKYFIARKQGKTKTEASIVSGYADCNHTTRIEATKSYKALEAYFRNRLLSDITINQIIKELAKSIIQDSNQEAKIEAIGKAINIIEPIGNKNED